MKKQPLTLGLIYGSSRAGRFCDTVVDWVARELTTDGRFTIKRMDPLAESNDGELKHIAGWADAFIVITPEYNHGYPAPLKSLIDGFSQQWWAKPVGFVSYGGVSGGIRAVEQLRQVFAELHAMTVRTTVSLSFPWKHTQPSGELIVTEQSQRSLSRMLAQLAWWAGALVDARESQPFEEVV